MKQKTDLLVKGQENVAQKKKNEKVAVTEPASEVCSKR